MASAVRSLFVPLSVAASRLVGPLSDAGLLLREISPASAAGTARCYATRPDTYFLRGKMLHCGDQRAKSPVLLNGRDFKHWLVVVEPPAGDPRNPGVPRSEIIEGYIKTLAQVVGSEEEARRLIYSVSTRNYFAFGASVSEELSREIRELPNVKWVLPDSYLDPEEKDYGGEPFVNGEAVPYDCKYHSEWLQNDAYSKSISEGNDARHYIAYYSPLSSSASESGSPMKSVTDAGALKQEITLKKSTLPTDGLDQEKVADSLDQEKGADSLDQENDSSNALDLQEKGSDQMPVSDDGGDVSEKQASEFEKVKAMITDFFDQLQAKKEDSEKLLREREDLQSLLKGERAPLRAEDKAKSTEDEAANHETESGEAPEHTGTEEANGQKG